MSPVVSVRRINSFVADLFRYKEVLFELSKNDLRSRYLGSFLGIIWAFVHPLATILILWFVFEAGFKVGPVNEHPFVLWLACGIIPWFFLSDSIASASNSVIEHGYLVEKVVFKVSLLPVVKILSALAVHLAFIIILGALYLSFGYKPSIHALQLLFYIGLTLWFILGISWFTASVVVFFRDLGQLIAILLQFGFWLTPIFWSIDMIPQKYHYLLKLNPAFFLIQGYRDSLLDSVWFWERPLLTLYFVGITAVLFGVGALAFIRLRPHFADAI